LRDQIVDEKLIEAARSAIAEEIAPIDDVRSTAEYRLRVAQNLLGDFLSNVGA
jgi:CO/xanthine dehydrogenase FAD-binding subunit